MVRKFLFPVGKYDAATSVALLLLRVVFAGILAPFSLCTAPA